MDGIALLSASLLRMPGVRDSSQAVIVANARISRETSGGQIPTQVGGCHQPRHGPGGAPQGLEPQRLPQGALSPNPS